MGAKQSSPTADPAANGRTRAYSGSDLPSSTSNSNGSNVSRTNAGGLRYHAYRASGASGATSSSSQHLGARARSVGGSGGSGTRLPSGINIPNSSGAYSSQESGGSSPEEAVDRERSGGGHEGPRLVIGSLPAHLSPQLFGGTAGRGWQPYQQELQEESCCEGLQHIQFTRPSPSTVQQMQERVCWPIKCCCHYISFYLCNTDVKGHVSTGCLITKSQ
ncbi:E3 ubiquitin-protein ligase znrf2 isoform X2 [Acanthopagrus latus]|uniref:E3 ubiquitin-protein ligase znrf2 isoform X2 n=1 Tax=Acanthopagrus latus TaxID=8177 RepID=UPI00187C6DF0|nr:E3 ubiquitin-protein ligase znrf2 isoform X2 [Acanthopagrus latus]